MHIFVLLQAVFEPGFVQAGFAIGTLLCHFAFECVLEGDGASILLTKEGADYGFGVILEGVAGYIVGECEEDEGVEVDVEAGVGGWVGREEGCCHGW